MCLILFAYKFHPRYPLIMAANRDEFYDRPTEPARFWADCPLVLAGRDLEKMGTWLGVTRQGRFAAVTNYRDPSRLIENPQSRGNLVGNFLTGNVDPLAYLKVVKAQRTLYNPFNLLLGDTSCCLYYSQTADTIEEIKPGLHGLSNHLLNTPWPKVNRGKEKLAEVLQDPGTPNQDKIFCILSDPAMAKNEDLPRTGVSFEWEQTLSSIFISSPAYGTRSSTVLLVDHSGSALFSERSFTSGQRQHTEVTYRYTITA